MDEREACERLVARYGPRRACTLIGARQLLALYGQDELVGRGWISQEQLAVIERDLRRAGAPWSSAGEDRETTWRRHMDELMPERERPRAAAPPAA